MYIFVSLNYLNYTVLFVFCTIINQNFKRLMLSKYKQAQILI